MVVDADANVVIFVVVLSVVVVVVVVWCCLLLKLGESTKRFVDELLSLIYLWYRKCPSDDAPRRDFDTLYSESGLPIPDRKNEL